MKSVLIISSSFMGIAESFRNAFIRANYKTELLLIDQKISTSNSLTCSVFGKFSKRIRDKCDNIKVDSFSHIVNQYINDHHPNIVLDLLGVNLNRNAVIIAKNTSYLIKYMLDSIENYPYLKKTIDVYDVVLTYESHDVAALKKYGARDVRIEYATYDNLKYYPIGLEKKVDVSFVGQMYTREQRKRKALLDRLIYDNPDFNFSIYGICVRPYMFLKYLHWKIFDNGKVYKNKVFSSTEVNSLYCSSKICLNINSYQTFNAWSSRLPEMMGTGSFVITEYTKESAQAFADSVAFYKNYQELLRNIRYYHAHVIEREKKSSLALHKVSTNYTIDNTVKNIIQIYHAQKKV